jgi:uncharacterized membrane protein (DUF373 family)
VSVVRSCSATSSSGTSKGGFAVTARSWPFSTRGVLATLRTRESRRVGYRLSAMPPTDDEEDAPPPTTARRKDFALVWPTLSIYERFEYVVAFVITALIAVIVLLATFDLGREVVVLVWHGSLDPLDQRMFQVLFGQIMTILIALEFKHSIIKAAAHRSNVIQVRTVLLIALLAITRKFIILDVGAYPATIMLALAASVVALGITYWLVRDRQDRSSGML